MTGQEDKTDSLTPQTKESSPTDPLAKLAEMGGAQHILSVESAREILKDTKRFIAEGLIAGQDYDLVQKRGETIKQLKKPGAEKLRMKFRLGVSFEVQNRILDWDKKVFYYEVVAIAVHVPSGVEMGRFIAVCHSREDKYRYRWLFESNLPPGTDKNSLMSEERKSKAGGKYLVYRMDNPNPEDQINTFLQMAEKRAFVGVIRIATCTSDQFADEPGTGNGDTAGKDDGKVGRGQRRTPGKSKPKPQSSSQVTGSVREAVYKHFKGDEDAVQDFLRKSLKATGTVPFDKLPPKELEKISLALKAEKNGGVSAGGTNLLDAGLKNVILLSLKSPALSEAEKSEIRAKLDEYHPHLVTDKDTMTRAEAERTVRFIGYKEEIASTREKLKECFGDDEDVGLMFAGEVLQLRDVQLDKLTSGQLLKLREATENKLKEISGGLDF